MDQAWWALCGTTFLTVFLAELGDKTQLAALGLASTSKSTWAVFWGSAAALVLASALAVGLGKLLSERVDPRWLHYGGAALFLCIGLLMLVKGPEQAEEAAVAVEAAREAAPSSASPGGEAD